MKNEKCKILIAWFSVTLSASALVISIVALLLK